jgi:hypothetical protein
MGIATSKITSGPEVKKRKGFIGSEIWGPYKKEYKPGLFGQQVFAPPYSVDNLRILCNCNSIPQYLRDNNTEWVGILAGTIKPACYDDKSTIMNPSGGDTYDIIYKHPIFYQRSVSNNGTMGVFSNTQASFMGIPWQGFLAGYIAKKHISGGRKTRKLRLRRLRPATNKRVQK